MTPKIDLKSFFICFFFLIGLISVCSANNVNSEKWYVVDTDKLYYVSLDSVQRDGHRRKILEFQNFVEVSSDGVSSMELITEYDCKKGTFRLINYRGYSDLNLEGELVFDWQGIFPRAFVGIPSKSPTRDIMERVCGYSRDA
ncbi:MAG: hypothetical protein CBC42_07875 [Betaproteobacteria bacterium TMED82]|nr:MAG: hypothetical protein CBC42_07875 [Betaproteobacteria bacterium TMED82]|tara:strand:- start:8389 stop:8814 length:426 start_codon:yes stop_codon:yes gene_type:complete